METSRLQFVILTPNQNLNRSLREKELEDAMVRSHAARVTHERRKAARVLKQSLQQVKSSKVSDLSLQESNEGYNLLNLHPNRRLIQSGPHSIGRQDPFATYAGHDVSAISLQALEYARETVFTPIWAPFRSEDVSSLEVSWKQVVVQHPFIFHAELANSINWTLLKFNHSNVYTKRLEVIQAQQRGLGLQALRHEIESPTSQPSAIHIHAIGLLAFESRPELNYSEPYPLSPMGELQQVYAASRCKTTPAHVNALYKTVALNGGIENMKWLASAHTLEFTDLCISTQLGQPPRFPLPRSRRRRSASPSMPSNQSGKVSEGLSVIRSINPQLFEILSGTARLTNIVDLYHHQNPNPLTSPLVKILVRRRNEVQHNLLAFQATSNLPAVSIHGTQGFEQASSTSRSGALTELIRLAALIYSDMILFPTAWISGIKPRLARQIKGVVETSQIQDQIIGQEGASESGAGEHGRPQPDAGLYVWILWFGCFAAYQSELQEWFEERLMSMLETMYGSRVRGKGPGKVDFEEARHGLWQFLWWGPVCDGPGKELWERVVSRKDAAVN